MTRTQAGSKIRERAAALGGRIGWDSAEVALAREIRADAELVDYAIWRCANFEVGRAATSVRGDIIGLEPEEEPEDPRDKPGPRANYTVAELARCAALEGKFLMWPLSSRKVLGDATRAEVVEEAEMYEKLASSNGAKGKFMRLLSRRLKDDQVVKEALDDKALARLWSRSRLGIK